MKHRNLIRAALGLGAIAAVTLGGAASVVAAIACPAPFFPYSVTVGAITVRSANPLPASAQTYLATVDLTPRNGMPALHGHFTVFLAESGWRSKVFFSVAQGAGGLTYAAFAPHYAFLSGADFDTGQLINRGNPVPPPRDLAYYLRHESDHLALSQDIGVLRFLRLPDWVREGIADVAALGAPDRTALALALGNDPVTLDQRLAFGSYPRARLLVDWVLETRGFDALLQTDWTEAQAAAAFVAETTRPPG